MIQPPDPNQPNLPDPTAYAPNNPPPYPADPNPPRGAYRSGSYPQPGNHPPPGGYPGHTGQPPPQRSQKRGGVIGGVALVVILIGVGIAALATHGFRQEPSSSWLSQVMTDSSSGKYVIFITWHNQDGQLTGIYEGAGSSDSMSVPFTGIYHYQDHSVTLIFNYQGRELTAQGTVDGDTMTLHLPFVSTDNTLLLHSATQQDFQNARNQLS